MKIIFLDFDGVLNHQEFYRRRETEINNGAPKLERPYSEIDPECIKLLNTLIEQTGANVVISSSWRVEGLEYCKDILSYHGFKGEIIGLTPYYRWEMSVRGNEIMGWINDNEEILGKNYFDYTDYVILDDDTDMLYSQRNNFIHIDYLFGITNDTINQAIKILNKS